MKAITMIKGTFMCVLYFTVLSSCSRYSVISKDKLEYCKDLDDKVFIFKSKTASPDADITMYGGAFLPFTYSDTFDNEFFQLQVLFMEKTYYNHQVIVTTNGKKYSVLRLDKFESKINVNETKYLDFISERNIDTSNLILLDCTKNQ